MSDPALKQMKPRMNPANKEERCRLRQPTKPSWEPWPGVQVVSIPAADLIALLDYIDKLEESAREWNFDYSLIVKILSKYRETYGKL